MEEKQEQEKQDGRNCREGMSVVKNDGEQKSKKAKDEIMHKNSMQKVEERYMV